ncbi:MAG: hypothetical protein JJE10_10050 [Thermoleophilia bacterium]|nr:hypothetical protein [Thermoleophilia bacterium]
MNRAIFLKSTLIQLASVAVLSIALAILLPKSFFESWGWFSGPAAWLVCAAFTATVLDLPRARTILGAVLAGLPSLIAVVIGLHWLGALIAVLLFGLWCGRIAAVRGGPQASLTGS